MKQNKNPGDITIINVLSLGSSLFSRHPGVPHRSGGDRSDEQDLPRHRQAPPRRLPFNARPSSLCLPALLTAAASLSRGPKGERATTPVGITSDLSVCTMIQRRWKEEYSGTRAADRELACEEGNIVRMTEGIKV